MVIRIKIPETIDNSILNKFADSILCNLLPANTSNLMEYYTKFFVPYHDMIQLILDGMCNPLNTAEKHQVCEFIHELIVEFLVNNHIDINTSIEVSVPDVINIEDEKSTALYFFVRSNKWIIQ